jgi:TonB family protein
MFHFVAFAPFASFLPALDSRFPSRETPAPGQLGAPAGRADRFGIYSVGGEVNAPVLRYSETAVYSDRMREIDAHGTVLVTSVLDIDGLPVGTDVLMPLRRPFDLAAIKTTNRMRFEPANIHGIPVPSRIFIEYDFRGPSSAVSPNIVRRLNPIDPPVALNSIWVAYPRRARRNRHRGTVVISFVVTTDGLPGDLRLIRSVSNELDESATRAVRRLRFKPAMRDGIRVPSHVTIDITFLLYF